MLTLAAFLLFISAAAAAPQEASSSWKVGVARVSITPPQPIWMAGYDAREKPFEAVETDIFAKAMAFEDGGGRRAVLVTADVVGFSAPVAAAVCAAITERTRLERRQILLNASHNHAGPLLSVDPRPRPKMSDAEAAATVAYTRALAGKIAGIAAEALARLEPARLSWGTGIVHFPMNRREPTPNGIILGVNPRGPVDRSVPVLRADGIDGRPRAILFGAACHNTTLTANNWRIAGDYAGYAQAAVEARYPGAQAMFVQGFGADTNPFPRGTLELAREHGATLGREVCRVADGKLEAIAGGLNTVFDTVDLPFALPSKAELERRAQGASWEVATARALLEMVARGEQPLRRYTAPVAIWQLGGVTLVAMSGEVVGDYAGLVSRALGPLNLWLAGYSNEVFGYLPSARILEEGGYETRGITPKGWFAPETQDVVVRKIADLAARAGRKAVK
jgi:neutral ceramidase